MTAVLPSTGHPTSQDHHPSRDTLTPRIKLPRSILALTIVATAMLAPAAQAQPYSTFSATGSLHTARDHATATLLKNGLVLIAGGTGDAGPVASAELFDPATGKFTETGALATGRYNATATLLPGGKVLIVGGYDDSNRLAGGELYDPSSGSFTPTTGSLTTGRDRAAATLLKNGKVLVAGGYDGTSRLASAEIYDPSTGQFTPTADMHEARQQPTATLLRAGKVLITGGFDGTHRHKSAEIYDPATGVFTLTGSLSTGRYVASSTLLPSGNVLIAGGFGDAGALTSAELYNPADGHFTRTGKLTTPRYWATSTLLPNGRVLIAGGYDGSGAWSTTETYDPAKGVFTQSYEHYNAITGEFTTKGGLVTGRYSAISALLPNGTVLVAGGSNDEGRLASAEIYRPTPAVPGKPTVKWAARKRLVTATVNLVNGTTYKLTAKFGRKTKTGRCKTKGSKATCTLAPGKGKWTFSITPHNAGGDGTANAKAVKL